jgi:hypothetical protein
VLNIALSAICYLLYLVPAFCYLLRAICYICYLQWTAMGPVRLACSWWARACSTRPSSPWVDPGTASSPCVKETVRVADPDSIGSVDLDPDPDPGGQK